MEDAPGRAGRFGEGRREGGGGEWFWRGCWAAAQPFPAAVDSAVMLAECKRQKNSRRSGASQRREQSTEIGSSKALSPIESGGAALEAPRQRSLRQLTRGQVRPERPPARCRPGKHREQAPGARVTRSPAAPRAGAPGQAPLVPSFFLRLSVIPLASTI